MQDKDKTMENKDAEINFIVKEIKERMDINKKSDMFKAAVDTVKGSALERLEEQYVQREKQMDIELGEIEMVLLSDDPERIKAALKGFQV